MPGCAAAYSVCKARQTRGGIRHQVAAAEFVLVEQLYCVGRLHPGIALRVRAQDGRQFSPFRFGQGACPAHALRRKPRYRVPWNVSLPQSPSASMPYSWPETVNSIRSPLSTWKVT